MDPTPTLKLKSTYLKPLTGGANISPDRALRTLQKELLRRIKAKLTQSTFSDRAKKSLARAVSIEVKASSLVIIAKDPRWNFMVGGQKPGQMTWLTKAKRPIPIVTESGDVIFRWATPRSMLDGKWWHPGRAPSDFLEQARQEARSFLRDKLRREFANQLRQAMSQKR